MPVMGLLYLLTVVARMYATVTLYVRRLPCYFLAMSADCTSPLLVHFLDTNVTATRLWSPLCNRVLDGRV